MEHDSVSQESPEISSPTPSHKGVVIVQALTEFAFKASSKHKAQQSASDRGLASHLRRDYNSTSGGRSDAIALKVGACSHCCNGSALAKGSPVCSSVLQYYNRMFSFIFTSSQVDATFSLWALARCRNLALNPFFTSAIHA